MRVLVSGASGLIGSALSPALSAAGHEVHRLVRRPPAGKGEVFWDPAAGVLDAAAFSGFDAVVHLAGESLASGRWNEQRKARILASRVDGTRLLAETVAGLGDPPEVLVCASAIGFYGDRGDEVLTEDRPSGHGFLADVCRQWEAAADPARDRTRVVHLRIGIVLSRRGGALRQMLTPFRFGLGGIFGSGEQYMSWIALDDLVAAVGHALAESPLIGPVNAVAPHPVTNRDFTRALGRVLRRPTLLPMPAWALRALFGEMGEELLLTGARVEPRRLVESGFEFRHPFLDAALRHELEEPAGRTG